MRQGARSRDCAARDASELYLCAHPDSRVSMSSEPPLPTDLLDYLGGQLRRGQLILFTGAGFSQGAMNRRGLHLPTAGELKDLLWALCYPGTPLDPATDLQVLFELANIQHRRA